jgi:DNA-binding MarR family transcriptional regulator
MHLALRILMAAQALEKAAQRVLRPYGVSPAQFNVLNILADQPKGMRSSDLARALIVDPSNITGLVKRMREEDFLVELENSADRRQHIVGLSPKGRTIWKAAVRDYHKRLTALDASLSTVERTTTKKVLQQLIDESSVLP